MIEARLLGPFDAQVRVSAAGHFEWQGQDCHVALPATWTDAPWRGPGPSHVWIALPDGTKIVGRVDYDDDKR